MQTTDTPTAGPSRPRQHRSTARRRIPPIPDGCTLGPEFVYDSEGQPQLFTPNPTEPEQAGPCPAGDARGHGQDGGAGAGRSRDCSTTASATSTLSPSDQHAHPTPKTPFKRIGRTPTHLLSTPAGRVIWVDFPPGDPANPLCFSKGKKLAIVGVAVYFTGITAYATSSYSIGIPSMCAELGCDRIQGAAGLALYAWGFGIAPLVLAPLSEEYGRKWSYIIAVMVFTVLHLMMTLYVSIFATGRDVGADARPPK